MAHFRRECYFEVRSLVVDAATLGARISVVRRGHSATIQIPADVDDFGLRPHIINVPAVYRAGNHAIVRLVRVTIPFATRASIEEYDKAWEVSLRALDNPAQKDLYFDLRSGVPKHPAIKEVGHFQNITQDIAEEIITDLTAWLRVLRWQTWLPPPDGRTACVWACLINEETQRQISTSGIGGTIGTSADPVHFADTDFLQTLARNYLGDQRPPLPLAEVLLAEALHSLETSTATNLREGVLFAAIACEVKVKTLLRDKQSHGHNTDSTIQPPSVAYLLDEGLSVVRGVSLRMEDKALYRCINELFKLRNQIAHEGIEPDINEAYKVVRAASDLFRWLSTLESTQ